MIKLSTNSKLKKIKIQQVNAWIHSDFDLTNETKFQHINSYNNSCYVCISIIGSTKKQPYFSRICYLKTRRPQTTWSEKAVFGTAFNSNVTPQYIYEQMNL
ncbi:Hypothetical_protein [Hexamita inflata]|uniref:Hypothetical_protein n=1 Tax=Hexamita inflata TaxID=28002 RepID=A0AA86QLH5_9EUKA|nr:Hypothetical protein HINF_LOCUS43627 [Hexamita inflata]